MTGDFFDRTPEDVLVDASTLRQAEQFIESCEHCNPRCAEIPFASVLDQITGLDPSVTDYIFEEPVTCPRCRHDILETTFIESL